MVWQKYHATQLGLITRPESTLTGCMRLKMIDTSNVLEEVQVGVSASSKEEQPDDADKVDE